MFDLIKSITKHSIIYGLGDFLSKGIGFFMIPLYTYYLSTSDYGTLELLELTTYIVGTFMGMGITESVLRYYYEYDEEEKRKQVISVAMISIWGVSLTVLIGLFFLSKQVSVVVFGSADYFRLFNIIFVTLVIQLSNGIPRALMRIEQKSVLYVSTNAIRLLLTLSLNIVFIVYLKMGVMGILISSLITTIMMGAFLMVYVLRRIRLSYSFELLFPMLKYGLPLMFTWFSMFIINFGDRFLLQRLASLSDVGIYSLAYKFGMLPNFLMLGPFMMIWAPKRFELVKEPDAKNIYATVFTYFCFLQLFLGLGISIIIREVLVLMVAPEFRGAYQYVPIILLSYILYGAYIYTQFGILLKKQTKYLALATFIGAGINIAGNFYLIPKYQVWGATLATLLSLSFIFVFTYPFAQRFYKIPYQFPRLLKMTLVAGALFIVATLINIPHIVLSLIVKSTIACSFPFILYVLNFYTPEELGKIQILSASVKLAIRASLSFASAKIGNLFRQEGR